MPKGPNGEKRPADGAQCAHAVFQIAIGETLEVTKPKSGRTRSGEVGAIARARKLSEDERKQIAQKAAASRWKRPHG